MARLTVDTLLGYLLPMAVLAIAITGSILGIIAVMHLLREWRD